MDWFIKYLIICFLLVLSMALLTIFKSNVELGFWGWIAFILSGTLFMTIGSFIGGVFLSFVRPDAYFTSGAMDAFYKRIFWSVGPQFIGGLIGFMACEGFMVNVLGLPSLG
ncbi:MAG: hypothetical protein ACRDC6_20355 [Shewanella sp.]